MGTQKELMWEGKGRCRELEEEVCLSSWSTDISWYLLGGDNVNGIDGGLESALLWVPPKQTLREGLKELIWDTKPGMLAEK